MYRQAVRQYRALCLGKPIGPWRDDREKMRQDLMQRDLGSYDEWGSFYVSVPGDIDKRWQIVEVEDAA